jgi:hypothetical protein
MPTGVRFMHWDRHTEVYRKAHRDAAASIRSRLEAGDAGIASVLRRPAGGADATAV